MPFEDTLEDFLAASDSDDSSSPVASRNKRARSAKRQRDTLASGGGPRLKSSLVSTHSGVTGLSGQTTGTSAAFLSSTLTSTGNPKEKFASFLQKAHKNLEQQREERRKKGEQETLTKKAKAKKEDSSLTAGSATQDKKWGRTEDFSVFHGTSGSSTSNVRDSAMSMRLSSDDEHDDDSVLRSEDMSTLHSKRNILKEQEKKTAAAPPQSNKAPVTTTHHTDDFDIDNFDDSMSLNDFEKEIMKDFDDNAFDMDEDINTTNKQQDTSSARPSAALHHTNVHEVDDSLSTSTIGSAAGRDKFNLTTGSSASGAAGTNFSYNQVTQRLIDRSEFESLKDSVQELNVTKSHLESDLERLKLENEELRMTRDMDEHSKNDMINSLRDEKNKLRVDTQQQLQEREEDFKQREKSYKQQLDNEREKIATERKEFRETLRKERAQWEQRVQKLEEDHYKELDYVRETAQSTVRGSVQSVSSAAAPPATVPLKVDESAIRAKIESDLKLKYDDLVKQLQDENDNLREQMSKERTNKMELRDKLDELKDQNQSYQRKLKRTQDRYEAMESNLETLRREKAEVEDKINRMEHSEDRPAAALTVAKSQMEKMLDATQEDNVRLLKQVKDLQKRLKDIEHEHEEETNRITSQHKDLMEETQRLDDIERQATLRESDLKHTIDRLQSSMTREKNSDVDEINRLRKTIDKLRDEKKETEREMFDVKRNALQKEQQNIMQLENKIQTMEVQHRTEINALRNKLQWYAENQQMLDQQQKTIKDLQRYTQELEKKVRRMETDESPDNPLVHKYNAQIKSLERELDNLKKKQKNPNSISQLIRATNAPDDNAQLKKLNDRIKVLENSLDQSQKETQSSLRSLRQESEKIQLQLEQRIDKLKQQNRDLKDKNDELADKNALSQKATKRAEKQIKDLENQEEETRNFYRKKVSDLEAQLRHARASETPLTSSRTDFASKSKIAELENELRMKEALITKMERIQLVPQPEELNPKTSFKVNKEIKSLRTELDQLKSQNTHLKAQNDLLIGQKSNWTKEENNALNQHLKRVSELEKRLHESQSSLTATKQSKEEAIEVREKLLHDLKQSLHESNTTKEKLIRDYERQLAESKREHQQQLDELTKKHTEERLKNSPDERDRSRLRKIEEMISRISDMESSHKMQEMSLHRQIEELKYQHEMEVVRAKQSYDLMLQRKNAEVLRFKMALDSLTADLRRMRQMGHLKRMNGKEPSNGNAHHTLAKSPKIINSEKPTSPPQRLFQRVYPAPQQQHKNIPVESGIKKQHVILQQ
mmetsp:Transcript_2302/g.8566  ORF Transcript_2302/g.8566 Transcript_2302/m.8566 type:complete len:1287 (-) Transcript_2302:115-3975(-)